MSMIGVSIALPDECGIELQSYRLSLGDEAARQIPSHVTLVPPVQISGELDHVIEHLRGVASTIAPFEVHLRGTGTFRPVSPVVFIALASGISECEQLAGAVATGPLAVDIEFPYHPHVTIAHGIDEAAMDRAFDEMADFECTFEVRSFWLYAFDPEIGWTKLTEFALTDPA